MKKLVIILMLVIASACSAMAQSGEYSYFVVKKTTNVKGSNYSYIIEFKHYLGNGTEKEYTKTREGIKFNELVDVLNELKKAGWKVVAVSSDTNIVDGDTKISLAGATNTIYTEYLLYKE